VRSHRVAEVLSCEPQCPVAYKKRDHYTARQRGLTSFLHQSVRDVQQEEQRCNVQLSPASEYWYASEGDMDSGIRSSQNVGKAGDGTTHYHAGNQRVQ